MIEKMKKLTFLVYHREYEDFLHRLQDLGVMHVATGEVNPQQSDTLSGYLDEIRRLTALEKEMKDFESHIWQEPVDSVGTGDRHIAELLRGNSTPKVLVINKIDTVPAEKVVAMINMYKDLADFDEIVPVSALIGRNEDDLKDVIFKLLPEGPMYYDEDELTDQPERQIVAEIVRESALKNLSDEVPHGIAVGIELMKERKKGGGYINYEENDAPGSNAEQGTGLFDIEATIVCERDSHKGIIIGKGGAMLKKIGTDARLQMEALLGFRVNLKLFVKVKKDWRDSDFLLKNYGFWEEKDET